MINKQSVLIDRIIGIDFDGLDWIDLKQLNRKIIKQRRIVDMNKANRLAIVAIRL
jgi:hypothetical protein